MMPRDIGILLMLTPDVPGDLRRRRGLCRTEHMFFEARLVAMREMIFADTPEDRATALARLLLGLARDFCTTL
jgi:pyruvate,orthophosphate dikinase